MASPFLELYLNKVIILWKLNIIKKIYFHLLERERRGERREKEKGERGEEEMRERERIFHLLVHFANEARKQELHSGLPLGSLLCPRMH